MSNYDFFDFLRECKEAFSEAFKYSEMDFYKLKSEVISLIDKARSKGYDHPAYCELSVSIESSYETDVTIQAYYKRDEKYYRFKKSLDLGKLVRIPRVINAKLNEDHRVTIKLEDFENLYSVKESEIIPEVDFRNLHAFTFRNVLEKPAKKQISIQDELFYYTVCASYIFEDGSRKISRKYYGYIRELPDDIISKIKNSEDKLCIIDVS